LLARSLVSDNASLIKYVLWIYLTEATFDILKRLNIVKFGGRVIAELFILDLPCEIRFPSGWMILKYTKAVQ